MSKCHIIGNHMSRLICVCGLDNPTFIDCNLNTGFESQSDYIHFLCSCQLLMGAKYW